MLTSTTAISWTSLHPTQTAFIRWAWNHRDTMVMMVVMVMVMVIGMVIGMGTMVIISGRSSLADAKSNDNLLPGDAFHIHNTITNTITVMKVIHYIFTPSSSLYCRWCTTPTWTLLSPAMPLDGSLDPFCRFVWNLIISNVVIIFLKLFQL